LEGKLETNGAIGSEIFYTQAPQNRHRVQVVPLQKPFEILKDKKNSEERRKQ